MALAFADQNESDWRKPKRVGRRLQRRFEQHVIPVPRPYVFDHLGVTVSGDQALAYEQTQVPRHTRVRAVDVLILTDDTSQILGNLPRTLFQYRGGQHFVRFHRIGGNGKEPDAKRENQLSHDAAPFGSAPACFRACVNRSTASGPTPGPT